MPDYADELLSGSITQKKAEKQPPRDWADKILSTPGVSFVEDPHKPGKLAPIQTGKELTGEISTITGKQQYEPISYESQKPGFGTMVKTGFVDEPETQMDILSRDMGIPRERFGVVDGDIVYRGDDGILYKAMPFGMGKMVAKQIPRIPAMAGGTIGSAFGPVTAGVLAAGGEAVRKLTGHLAFDEPQKPFETAKDIALEGVFAYGGEKIGGKFIRAIDRGRGKQAASLMKLSGVQRKSINPKTIKEIENLAKKFDIDLFVPQTTGSHELIARFNLLGDLPITADKIGKARLRQYAQINDSVNKWLNTFAPPTTTPGEAGRRAVEASVAAMKAAKRAAQKVSKKFYDQARVIRGVDISDTVESIDSMLQTAPRGGAEARSLNKIKTMLTRKTTDSKGREIIVLEDRISTIDKVKKEINAMWKKDPKTAPDVDAQRSINKTLESMLDQVDDQVPVYKQARQAYRKSIQESGFEELQKTKLAQISKMEGDKAEKVATSLLSPSQSSPEIVDIAKDGIVKHGGPEAWNALLRVHLKNKFRDIIKSNTTNIGGMLRKKLYMDLGQRDILKAAMNDAQFETFENLMKVLERAGLTAGRESTTATRQVSLSQLSEEAAGLGGKLSRSIAYPLYTGKRIIVDWRLRLKSERYQDMLADAMLDPGNSKRFRAMLQLKPGSEKLIKQLATFLTSLSAGTYRESRKEHKGVPPPTLGYKRPRLSPIPKLTK